MKKCMEAVVTHTLEGVISTLKFEDGSELKVLLSKQAARHYSAQLRMAADEMRDPGCTDPFAHWEGHCKCT